MVETLIKSSFRKTTASQRPNLSRNIRPPSPPSSPSGGIILICANIHIGHVSSLFKEKEHYSQIAFLLADSKLILLNSFLWNRAAGTLSSWGKEHTITKAPQSFVSQPAHSVYAAKVHMGEENGAAKSAALTFHQLLRCLKRWFAAAPAFWLQALGDPAHHRLFPGPMEINQKPS